MAGIRTPRPLVELTEVLPEAYDELIETMERLERTYKNMQDVEFTIEEGELFLLQTRNGKRSAQAMARIAVEMCDEGLRDRRGGAAGPGRPRTRSASCCCPSSIWPRRPTPLGDAASTPRRAPPSARSCFTADEAERRGLAGEAVILVRDETTPDDFHGMVEAQGILTARGGKTSHAAIVAVGMGMPAVCGVSEIRIDEEAGVVTIGDVRLRRGRRDHDRRHLRDGLRRATRPCCRRIRTTPTCSASWSGPTRARRLARAHERRHAGGRGAGPGVRRRGHRPLPHRAHVPGRGPAADRAGDDHGRRRRVAVRGARPAAGLPGERLRGHLPGHGRPAGHHPAARPAAARVPARAWSSSRSRSSARTSTGRPDPEAERQLARVRQLHEVNPMLGTRGCRLGIEWPDVYRMQVAAIMSRRLHGQGRRSARRRWSRS